MWNYTNKVKKHFLNPKNVGIIKNPDGVGEVGSLACGDALKLTLKLNKKGLIKNAKFQTFGCASAIASSSALTEMVKGKSLEEAKKITNKDIANYLGGLPKEKMHCSVMGHDALNKAILSCKGKINKQKKNNIICNCFEISKDKIKKEIEKNNISSIEEVTNLLKAGSSCGKCHKKIKNIINSYLKNKKNRPKVLTSIQKIKMIESSLEKYIKPALKKDGGDIDLVDFNNNKVLIKLRGACASCKKSKITLKHYVETKLRELVSPDLVVEEE